MMTHENQIVVLSSALIVLRNDLYRIGSYVSDGVKRYSVGEPYRNGYSRRIGIFSREEAPEDSRNGIAGICADGAVVHQSVSVRQFDGSVVIGYRYRQIFFKNTSSALYDDRFGKNEVIIDR